MASYYTSRTDLEKLGLGVPIQTFVRVKPNTGYHREDIRIHGDRIGLIDVNGRVREEYECTDIYDGSVPVSSMFESGFPPYLRAVLEGVNVGILAFGTTGTGKTYNVEGEGTNAGLVHHFTHGIFQQLEDKKYRLNGGRAEGQSVSYNYSVKMRYIEIVDEDIKDLLVQANSRAQGELDIVLDEWEGPSVNHCTWLPTASASHLIDMYQLARRNRTDAANEFGPLHEKSTSLLTFEILQVTNNSAANESTVLASRLQFFDLPGAEKLHEDVESLRIREGTSLNRGIMCFSELTKQLNDNIGGFVRYDDSMLTAMLKDVLGGNCLTVMLMCLQNGDTVGSSLSLNYMRQLRAIMNFPVVNDNRMLGLLHKYRVEVSHLLNQLMLNSPESIDGYNSKIGNLEKELIEGNLNKLKDNDEKSMLLQRLKELKESFNKLVKEKADLQADLIASEEDRLQVSKALIELQIENAQLLENHQDKNFDVNTKILQAENEVLAANMKEEKALQAINEMQDKLKKALLEKREIEIEFVALKTNYLNLMNELNEEKLKNENLQIEVINLVNANKALSGDTDVLVKIKGDLSEQQRVIELRNIDLTRENRDLNEALLNARAEIEQLRSELVKHDINLQRAQMDVENKKMALEREFMEMNRKVDDKAKKRVDAAGHQVNKMKEQVDLDEADRITLSRQLKVAQRKIAELEDNLNEYMKHDREMTEEAHRLQLQIEEMRSSFRTKLMKAMNEGIMPDDQQLTGAREELVRSYNEREADLSQRLNKEYAKNAHLVKVIRGLRAYARSLKNLSEDWAPIGQPLPEVLTLPPPILLEDEDQTVTQKAQMQEIQRLRTRCGQLEQEVKTVQAQLLANTEHYTRIINQTRDPTLQRKIMTEIDYLKSSGRPDSSPNANTDDLRRERNSLKEENRKLLQEIRDVKQRGGAGPGGSNGGNERALQEEVERLNKKLKESVTGSTGNPRSMQQKISYLEEVLRKLERERSELSVRATMAEEQLKNLQEHMNNSIQNYQRKISELKKIIQQMRSGRPVADLDAKLGDSLRGF
mmetsp:Transcript_452/g.550  ORF Transcript_452/g.550 Transcript_452/m.550 type:complete len:1047 (-) Transcript_452:2300-5440(-)